MRITLAVLGALAFGAFLTQSATAGPVAGNTNFVGDRLIFDEPNNINDIFDQDGLTFDLGLGNFSGTLTVTSSDGPVRQDLQPPDGGLGVDGAPEDDNAAYPETLDFAFTGEPDDLFVSAISFNYGPGSDHKDIVKSGLMATVGSKTISFDGVKDDWILGFDASPFTVAPSDGNDGGLYVESLTFSSGGGGGQIPTPASLLLIGVGLFTIGVFRQLVGRSL